MSELIETEVRALHEALEDEYKAWSTYDQVIEDFGEVRPFVNIREAEARHIDALLGLFERYGLPVPENPWSGRVERYRSVNDACEAGIEAEIANGEMYERLLASTQREDLVTVLTRLRDASQQRHLPAFRRCAQRAGGAGGGDGRQRRRRRGHQGGRGCR